MRALPPPARSLVQRWHGSRPTAAAAADPSTRAAERSLGLTTGPARPHVCHHALALPAGEGML